MGNFFEEFKKFAMRGSLIDLAVGIVIGGAFQKIIASFVSDIALPSINPLIGVVEFSKLRLWSLNVGNFFEASLNFFIMAFFVFFLVKGVNSLRNYGTKNRDIYLSKQEQLLIEIRDLLKKQK